MKDKKIGTIVPPLELKSIIESTALYVAQNGRRVEEILMQNQKDNPTYHFLNVQNPYHNYYDQKVLEFTKQQVFEKVDDQPLSDQEEVEEVFSFDIGSPQMSLMQARLIQKTAFYVSCFGEEFLEEIQEKKRREPSFAFLNVTHPLFIYFTKLIDSYLELRNLGPEVFQRLHQNVTEQNSILQRIEEQVRMQEVELEERRGQMQETEESPQEWEYDWENFKIVQTIDFYSEQTVYQEDKIIDEDRYKINPQNAIILNAMKIRPSEKPSGEDKKQEVVNPKMNSVMIKCMVCQKSFPGEQFQEHYEKEMRLRKAKIETPDAEPQITQDLDKFLQKRMLMKSNRN